MYRRILLAFLFLSFCVPAFYGDDVSESYLKYLGAREENDPEPLLEFARNLSEFKETQKFAMMQVQHPEMAELVLKMEASAEGDGGKIDVLANEYLIMKQNLILLNQRYILYVTLILSLIVFFSAGILFYNVLVEEKKRISAEVLSEIENERARISFELHDTVSQEISGAILQLSSERKATSALKMLENSQSEIRRILASLNPPGIKESSLVMLLQDLSASFSSSSGIECSLSFPKDLERVKFDERQKLNIFRIVQESLTNVQKHAEAESVQIIFRKSSKSEKRIVFLICDDGCGFEKAREKERLEKKNPDAPHFGLKSIARRVSILGGELKITSENDLGTTIKVEMGGV